MMRGREEKKLPRLKPAALRLNLDPKKLPR
jgi:hypothetical protein